MQKEQFYYDLPKELIAQHHAIPRDTSRLLCMSRETGEYKDMVFRDVMSLLQEGDVLVLNDSKVLPARLIGSKRTGAKIEILLLKDMGDDRWECLVKPGKRLKSGTKVSLGSKLSATIIDELEDGNRLVEFEYDHSQGFYSIIDEIGLMPLPHYITEPLSDNNEYQTVYANELGSSAAPTAGLHFTDELLEELYQKGIEFAKVTLHVGLGTFRPVKVHDITEHKMHTEHYTISKQAADTINTAKANGCRIVCVGTTSCRTLESCMKKYGEIRPCEEDTDIFIYPGYTFKIMDALITNFHLPESTLIMLVSAFAGYENTMRAYKHAVEDKYRFYSFGDAMIIL